MSVVLDEEILSSSSPIADIAQKIYDGARISREDALRLYLGMKTCCRSVLWAKFVRRRKAGSNSEKHVYYIHNMHLNPTNFCVETCRFCSYANPGNNSYTWTVEQVLDEARKGAQLGINEIHMVGGLNPICNLEYYEEVLRAIKAEFPQLHFESDDSR